MSPASPYASRTEIPLRYADLDTLGHVNQAVYHVLLEEGRRGFFVDAAGDHPGAREAIGAAVVARVEIDHRHELRIEDGQAIIETTLRHVGRSSLQLASRITNPSGTLAAEAVTVLVAWDMQARSSRAFSEDERARLAELVTPVDPAA